MRVLSTAKKAQLPGQADDGKRPAWNRNRSKDGNFRPRLRLPRADEFTKDLQQISDVVGGKLHVVLRVPAPGSVGTPVPRFRAPEHGFMFVLINFAITRVP